MANSFTVMSNMNTVGKNEGAMLLTLRGVSLFPFVLTPVFVDEKDAVDRMRKAYDGNRLVAFFQEVAEDFPEFVKRHPDCRIRTVRWQDKELSQIGCRARIVKLMSYPDGSIRLLLRSLARCEFRTPVRAEEPSYFPLIKATGV